MAVTTWHPASSDDYSALKGFAVYTSDDRKLGTITEVCHPALDMPAARGKHYFRVDPGPLKRLLGAAEEVIVPERLVRMVEPEHRTVILDAPWSLFE